MRREALDDRLLERADHDDVAHPGNDLRGILHRLATAQLRIARVQVDGGPAQLVHAGLERQAGAGGGLLENHHQRAVCQRVVCLVALEAVLDEARAREQVVELFAGEIIETQEMLDRHLGDCSDPRRPLRRAGWRRGIS